MRWSVLVLCSLVAMGCGTPDDKDASSSADKKSKASGSAPGSASPAPKAPAHKPVDQLTVPEITKVLGKAGFKVKTEDNPIELDNGTFTQPEYEKDECSLYVRLSDYAKLDKPGVKAAYKIGKDYTLLVRFSTDATADAATARKILAGMLAKADPPLAKDIESVAKEVIGAELTGFREDGTPAVNKDDMGGNSDTEMSFLSASAGGLTVRFDDWSGTSKGKGATAGFGIITGASRFIHLTPVCADDSAGKKITDAAIKAITENGLAAP